jgi:hypothetical protein
MRVGPFLSGIADGLRDGSVATDDVAPADNVIALTRAVDRKVRAQDR